MLMATTAAWHRTLVPIQASAQLQLAQVFMHDADNSHPSVRKLSGSEAAAVAEWHVRPVCIACLTDKLRGWQNACLAKLQAQISCEPAASALPPESDDSSEESAGPFTRAYCARMLQQFGAHEALLTAAADVDGFLQEWLSLCGTPAALADDAMQQLLATGPQSSHDATVFNAVCTGETLGLFTRAYFQRPIEPHFILHVASVVAKHGWHDATGTILLQTFRQEGDRQLGADDYAALQSRLRIGDGVHRVLAAALGFEAALGQPVDVQQRFALKARVVIYASQAEAAADEYAMRTQEVSQMCPSRMLLTTVQAVHTVEQYTAAVTLYNSCIYSKGVHLPLMPECNALPASSLDA